MTRKVIDGVLLLAALVGGVLVWQTGRERARLRGDYERLVREIGELPIGDPSKVHVRALETGEPLHFAWRIYLPPNHRTVLKERTGYIERKRGYFSESEEFIARIRFREDEKGDLYNYDCFSNSSGTGIFLFRDEPLAQILRGRWDNVVVEQLGAGDLATVAPDGQAVFLRLSLPKDMEAEARKSHSPFLQGESSPVFFELTIGPEMPKAPPARPGK